MARSYRQLIKASALALLGVSVVGCSTVRPLTTPAGTTPVVGTGGDATSPAPTTAPTPSANTVLLDQSRSARAAGNYSVAAAALDRALRIAPNDPALWLEYGELRMAEGDYQQAATLARKSASLAGENRAVRDAANALIADAERAQRSQPGR